jgi:hypothetical protein
MPGMIHRLPASPAKATLQRFMAENAGVSGSQFSGWRRPLPPANVFAQGGTAEVLITWSLPSDPTINGFYVYQNNESNRVLTTNATTTQARIKALASMPTGFYVSSFNALKESVKVPVIGQATSDLYVVTGTSGGTGGTSPSPPPGSGGGSGCFSGNVAIETPQGFVMLEKLPPWFDIANDTGVHRVRLIVHEEQIWDMIDMGNGKLVTPEHPIRKENGVYVSAQERFPDFLAVKFWGPVYNLEVLSHKEEDLHYRLENGYVAHNIRKPGF